MRHRLTVRRNPASYQNETVEAATSQHSSQRQETSVNDTTTNEFSEEGFWTKIAKFALAAGRETIEKCLWLWYAFRRSKTPAWAKSIILGALTYFIVPMDAIPDVAPGIGYTDDLGVLSLAIAAVAAFIDDDVKQMAVEKLKEWFG